MSGYPNDWGSRRDRALQRDNYQCQHCKAEAGPKENVKLNVHHIVPIAKGGEHHLDNLQTLCRDCHTAVHGSSMAPTRESRRNDSYGHGARPKGRSSSHKKLKNTVYETTNGTQYSVKYGSHPSHRTVELHDKNEEKPYKKIDPDDMSTEEEIGLLVLMAWIGTTLYLAWQTGSIWWGGLIIALSFVLGGTIWDQVHGHGWPWE